MTEQNNMQHEFIDQKKEHLNNLRQHTKQDTKAGTAKCYTQEINNHWHNEPGDERYGMEIFRRAALLRNDDARATLQRQFTENVHFWFAHHTYREAALRHEQEQVYIDSAFQRFWRAISDQALTFTSLAGALRYLKLCLHSAIMDMLRIHAYARLETLPEQEHPAEPQIENRHNESELWETISNSLANEQERRVAYLHFRCNLQPHEIMRHCPNEFTSEGEIYQLKRNIMERIMRNVDKIRWRLDDPHC